MKSTDLAEQLAALAVKCGHSHELASATLHALAAVVFADNPIGARRLAETAWAVAEDGVADILKRQGAIQ